MRRRIGLARAWRSRGFWLGLAALAIAVYAQKLTTVDRAIARSIGWYSVAILVMLFAWAGTSRRKSFLLPLSRPDGPPGQASLPAFAARRAWPRYLVALAALLLNLFSAGRLRADFSSRLGGFCWLASLLLLVAAFAGERPRLPRPTRPTPKDIEDRTDLRISLRTEILLLLAIFALALGLRLYRLGDWTTGMHGDEGEAGMEALAILEGARVSPFRTGWFAQPNVYYWAIALTMKVFGTSLFGLRLFSVIAGMLMFPFFYALVRLWFGRRTALFASVFLAISDVTIHFTRIQLSNITTPVSLVVGFWFLFRGLRSLRPLDFVWSGYGFMLGLYFYNGARLTPVLVAAVLIYLFLLMPALRVPGAAKERRTLDPRLGRARALRDAALGEARSVKRYAPPLLAFTIASVCLASPFAAYFLENRKEMSARVQEKVIFDPSNHVRMVEQHGARHDPLFLRIHRPGSKGVFPELPFTLGYEPGGIRVADDGFWPYALWRQTTTTLSMLTYRGDASSIYTFTEEPVAKPIEAALIILGLAWAAWRWRDERMGVLSLWFWSAIFAGGVLTIDAPYPPRLVGILPCMAIFAALPLSKLSAEAVRILAGKRRPSGARRLRWRSATVTSGGAVLGLLAFLTAQNIRDYYLRYLKPLPFTAVTGQAVFVRQMRRAAASEGRPEPLFYNLGAHDIYWGYGTNRFLNHGTSGADMANPSQELPLLDEGGRDVVFLVWDNNRHYLGALRSYYPEGKEGAFLYGPRGKDHPLFRFFRVRRDEIEARRSSQAIYLSARGPAIERREPGLGKAAAPPEGLTFPVEARWKSALIAPAFGRYRFALETPGRGILTVNGRTVLTLDPGKGRAEGVLLLARGPQEVEVLGTLFDSATPLSLRWSAGESSPVPVERRFLWCCGGRGLLGEVRPVRPEAPAGQTSAGEAGLPATLARVDGFLGMRDTASALGAGALDAAWSGTLTVPRTGSYTFEVFSNGASAVFIDGRRVAQNTRPGPEAALSDTTAISLTAGPHQYDLRYSLRQGPGQLEAFWTPPGSQRQLLLPEFLRTEGGIVDSPAVANGSPHEPTELLEKPRGEPSSERAEK